MGAFLGLDVGTNSVGSAWVDTDTREITLGVSVFPAGVDEKRKPKAQKRREKRAMRRTVARKAQRKRQLRKVLAQNKLLPSSDVHDPEFVATMAYDPWLLRSAGLARPLTPYEFGRVLVHLNQRRGWRAGAGDEDDADRKKETGKIKEAVAALKATMRDGCAQTFGQFMATLRQERTHEAPAPYKDPVRNRMESYEFHAERELVKEEFAKLWESQSHFASPLAALLTPTLRTEIGDKVLFFQRDTYWRAGTLGRCDLEPTDRRCPKADMYAQRFLMLETVNRIKVDGEPLTPDQRAALIARLSKAKSASPAGVRRALGIRRGEATLNIDRERKPEVNTDWFSAAIVHKVFGAERWAQMRDSLKESVNRAVQKFGPPDEQKLRAGAEAWWGLDPQQVEEFISAWKGRPNGETRLSRRAIRNLLPHLEAGLDVTTAKIKCGYPPHGYRLNKATRRFLKEHPHALPPAPFLPNPVVRKAIHEVRRHIQAYLHKFGRKPDHIVVELAREARQSAKARDLRLKANRDREADRKRVLENIIKPMGIDESQWQKAINRVLLCERQRFVCPYSATDDHNATITVKQAAQGVDVEVDHVVPWSRSFDNSLDNKVLCRRQANRDKGNRTPKEWLPPERFAEMENRLAHYRADHPRAWHNLHRDVEGLDDFIGSQLTDTGYITREVVAYLRQTLYRGEPQRVLCTRGTYTAILRRDWGLVDKAKSRADHRHHAIDAVAIALTDRPRLQLLSKAAAERERANRGGWPKREPLPPPWKPGFRTQVMALVDELIVCHRPQRRVSGALHEDSLYGLVSREEGLFTIRIPAARISPPMLTDPIRRVGPQGRVTWSLGAGGSGVVRDGALRKHIRECLQANGLNPDSFTPRDMTHLVQDGQLRMPSGVPIRRVRLLRKHSDPVELTSDPHHPRYYRGGNNHHMEILEDRHTGRWTGRCVTMFEATQRVRPPKGVPKLPLILGPHAEELGGQGKLPSRLHAFYQGRRFAMVLFKGDTLHMRDPDTGAPSFFTVIKFSPGKVQLVDHSDARPSTARGGQPARRVITKSPAELQALGPADNTPPRKVRISCLGEVIGGGQ